MTFWCGGVAAAAAVAIAHGSAAVVVPVLMFGVGSTMGYRLFRLSVVADGETLVVRNNLRTHLLQRNQVEGFRSGTPSGSHGLPIGQVIYVLLRDSTLMSLDVTTQPLPFGWGQRRVQRQEWLGVGPVAS